MDEILLAVGRELQKLNPGLVLLVVSWFVGLRISASWNLRQKRKELDLTTAHEFHKLYGEFFSVWKIWDDRCGIASESEYLDILTRACDTEGKLEAILVRIACSRGLDSSEISALGTYRQLFKKLRESISNRTPLPWRSSENRDYIAFKNLATEVEKIILKGKGNPETEAASQALLHITSNEWELVRPAGRTDD